MVTLDGLYRFLGTHLPDEEQSDLDKSLDPRSKDYLFGLVADTNVARGAIALDIGCGSGRHTVELAERFDLHVLGIDRLFRRVRQAAGGIGGLLSGTVAYAQGDASHLPLRDDVVDLVWNRDMLPHVLSIEESLAECARVMKPGAVMVLYTTVSTPTLEPCEASSLRAALLLGAEGLDADALYHGVDATGLQIVSSELLGGEFAEHAEETDSRHSRDLMRLARMIRRPEYYRAMLGSVRYEAAVALYRWWIYHLLGKLSSAVIVARKPI